MSSAVIALIILLITIIMFFTELLPLSITAMLAAIAMGVFGVMDWSDVFSGMSNSITLFLVGCGILGASYFSTGLSDVIGARLMKIGGQLSEKRFILVLFLIGAVTSAFFNGAMIVAIMFPIIDALAQSSKGRITRKQLYLPTAISTVIGSNITTIGSTSMMLAVGLLASSEYSYTVSFFEPLAIGLPGIVITFLIYATFGYRMQNRIFNFPDVPPDIDIEQEPFCKCGKLTKHQWIVIFVTLLCIGSLIAGFNYGAAGFLAAAILVITGCIDLKHAYRSVSWDVVFLVVGSLGIAKGLASSGASSLIADATLHAFSFLNGSPCGMCIVILLLSTLLSNFMSNGATVSIVVPIALSIALAMNTPGTPFVLAAAIGANISVATPISVTQVTMSCAAGYRFRDLLKMGGFINFLAFLVTSLALAMVYYI